MTMKVAAVRIAKETPPSSRKRGWGLSFLVLLFAFSLSACAFFKGVVKDPASRNTVYGKYEKIVSATKLALESHDYTIESSDPVEGVIMSRSKNEIPPEEGYQGYLLTTRLEENRYGGRKITFERKRIVESKKGRKFQQESQDAPDKGLFRDLIRQISQQVMP